eukprot:Selendium_serpulae@DN3975_c0_g1_i2.p1
MTRKQMQHSKLQTQNSNRNHNGLNIVRVPFLRRFKHNLFFFPTRPSLSCPILLTLTIAKCLIETCTAKRVAPCTSPTVPSHHTAVGPVCRSFHHCMPRRVSASVGPPSEQHGHVHALFRRDEPQKSKAHFVYITKMGRQCRLNNDGRYKAAQDKTVAFIVVNVFFHSMRNPKAYSPCTLR